MPTPRIEVMYNRELRTGTDIEDFRKMISVLGQHTLRIRVLIEVIDPPVWLDKIQLPKRRRL